MTNIIMAKINTLISIFKTVSSKNKLTTNHLKTIQHLFIHNLKAV